MHHHVWLGLIGLKAFVFFLEFFLFILFSCYQWEAYMITLLRGLFIYLFTICIIHFILTNKACFTLAPFHYHSSKITEMLLKSYFLVHFCGLRFCFEEGQKTTFNRSVKILWCTKTILLEIPLYKSWENYNRKGGFAWSWGRYLWLERREQSLN